MRLEHIIEEHEDIKGVVGFKIEYNKYDQKEKNDVLKIVLDVSKEMGLSSLINPTLFFDERFPGYRLMKTHFYTDGENLYFKANSYRDPKENFEIYSENIKYIEEKIIKKHHDKFE